tara:strand:+ start:576 stop:773 length:198 start_codon:yes stop_codon:yes gene_type:complete
MGNADGQVAQLVEQWTENPRVGGSNPPLTTLLFRDSSPNCRARLIQPLQELVLALAVHAMICFYP